MIHQKIITEKIIYSDSETTFEGTISWNASLPAARPGILVAHTFRGQSDFETAKAEELARQGYTAFAIDMYGLGKRAKTQEEAEKLLAEISGDRPLLLQRILLATKVLGEHRKVDRDKIGAIGFCFGGKCVLDLARSSANIAGVVSFHGLYDRPGIPYSKPISASVLVLHGWEDPLAKPDQTLALAQELTERGADWQILAFGNTGHAFTNPKAASPENGMFYRESSDKRAWKAMSGFFEELFQE